MKKKSALLAAALGAAALALTACGSSTAPAPTSAVIPEVEATALPGETPAPNPTPTETTPPGASADPMALAAKKVTASVGEDFTLKFEGELPKGNGITVITDNGDVAVMSSKGVDIDKKTAFFTAKKAGTIKISLGPVGPDGKFGAVGPGWSVYEVTVK